MRIVYCLDENDSHLITNSFKCAAHLCIISCVRLLRSALVVVQHETSFIVMFQGCNESSTSYETRFLSYVAAGSLFLGVIMRGTFPDSLQSVLLITNNAKWTDT